MKADEPTVLDYVKSLLLFWKQKPINLPPLPSEPGEPFTIGRDVVPEERSSIAPVPEPSPAAPHLPEKFPWFAMGALALALVAQISLEPRPPRDWMVGAFLYLLAAAGILVALWKGEWVTDPSSDAGAVTQERPYRITGLYIALPALLLAFLSLGGNRFTELNVFLWVLSIGSLVWAFWQPDPSPAPRWQRLSTALRPPWQMKVSPWALLVLTAFAVSIFFRLYLLNQVPLEMVSDQAEKLLDVWDILHGQASIFFVRNTGREAFQMYLTAAVIQLFNTGYTFLSLKIGTALCGLLTLPFIYGLGKEAGSRRAGLIAMLLAGIGYWPNVISRAGLRYTLYPFFAAATLYYLVRGLRTRSRNDFILSGLFLGAGLHGYSPFRILPFVILAAFLLYILHRHSQGIRRQVWGWLSVIVVTSTAVFLPLLRYMVENPSMVSYRALTRLSGVEQALPGPAWLIFLKNMWNALRMFAWDNGEVWVISIPHRPALDIISGALFHLGLLWLIVRYLRHRSWLDLFLLVSIPLLLLSSALSLAFPNENPILNRTGAAFVPAFIITGLALDGLMTGIEKRMPAWGRLFSLGVCVILLGLSMFQNYDLVFRQYQRQYQATAWNTSEMGEAVRAFGEIFGTTDTAWLVGYPYWADSRLVGFNAGLPASDIAIFPEQIPATFEISLPKMFIVNLQDTATLELLRSLYPQGSLTEYPSRVGMNFYIYLALPAQIP